MTQEGTPVVAAFDLDGTLTEGGSVFAWLRHIAGAGKTYGQALRLIVPLGIGALRSGRWADGAKERLFRALLAGRYEADLVERSKVFATEHLANKQREKVVARLRWHKQKGHLVVIVSASPQLYVEMVAEQLGADGALGTRLGVDARGAMTGSYLGKNCRGKEKMRRLDEWLAERFDGTTPEIYAYGNSRGDRRLLAGATHPYNVGKLGRLGALRRFPRLQRDPDD